MNLSSVSDATRLTKHKKQLIRRNEQIYFDHYYEPPQTFILTRVGRLMEREQGDEIVGRLKLVTTQKIACQLIYIEFKGFVQVDFNVPSTTLIDEIENYHKEWEFFNHKVPMFLQENRGYNFLEPGVYEFFFKVRVPIGGPCSFVTDIGSVTYRIVGVLVRNEVTAHVLTENTLVYHVRGYKDINPYAGARIGVWQEGEVNVGGILRFWEGRIKLRVKTDRRAYIPGEKIHVFLEFMNTSWRKCPFQYAFVQKTVIWGDHFFWRSNHWGSRHLKDTLVMERGQSRVIQTCNLTSVEEMLQIPKRIEPSYLGMSAKDFINDIINLEYFLEFEIEIPYSTNLRLSIPIVIGTEPFIFLPDPPNSLGAPSDTGTNIFGDHISFSTMTDQQSQTGSADRLIKSNILNYGNPHKSDYIPRFHPLNPSFQKMFPQTYVKTDAQAKDSTNSDVQSNKSGMKLRKNNRKHKSKCKCKSSKNKESNQSKSRDRTENKRENYFETHQLKADYGEGISLEGFTYSNWLASVAADEIENDPEKEANNALLNFMKEYGILP